VFPNIATARRRIVAFSYAVVAPRKDFQGSHLSAGCSLAPKLAAPGSAYFAAAAPIPWQLATTGLRKLKKSRPDKHGMITLITKLQGL
jgi:hypothetical protein